METAITVAPNDPSGAIRLQAALGVPLTIMVSIERLVPRLFRK